jgi:hypothetical protein
MYLESKKTTYKRFYHLFIKRHFFGITNSLRVLPDFFVIGPGRTGTTSLYHYLDQHPSLSKSAYDELGFFDVNFHLGLSWYRSLFPSIFTQYRIKSKTNFFMTYDVTPSYVRRPWNAKRIKKLFPNTKLIMVLRNPVDKSYSHYHLNRKLLQNSTHLPGTVPMGSKENPRTFEEVIKDDMENISKWNIDSKNDEYFATKVEKSILARGFYVEQLLSWFELFSKNQILIISSEELASNTKNTMNEIFKFLNLPEYEIPNIDKINVSKYSKINPKTRKTLIDFFRPYNEQLFKFLDRKFDWNK